MTVTLQCLVRRRLSLMVVLLLLLAPLGCMSADDYRDEADEDSYALLKEGRRLAGQSADDEFTIDAPDERLRDRFLLKPIEGDTPGITERLARVGESVKIDLATAIAISARNSREFQSEKERLYQAALSLTGDIYDFGTQFFGTVDASATASGDGDSSTTLSVAENNSLGFTRLLQNGGSFSLAIGQGLTRVLNQSAGTSATSFVNLSLSLPFLRGAGRDIAMENVRQGEWDLIYAVRDYERFKREFAVSVVNDYLGILQGRKTVENEFNNYQRRQQTAEENRALGEAGRIARTDLERANQAELSAESRWISAKQNHENSLDRFKVSLGLPPDAKLEIDSDDLARLTETTKTKDDISSNALLIKALANRLDLATSAGRVTDARRKVVVAADALRAGLDFTASVSETSTDYGDGSFALDLVGNGNYSLGLLLDLPLDRVPQRNAYRQSLISLDATERAFEAFEDQVKIDVRRAERSLSEARDSYRIQSRALLVSEVNVDAARLLKDAGTGSTNDLIDAQNDLIAAENAVTAALVDVYVSRLELLRDLGVLVVTPSGIDETATRRLLLEE